MASDNTTHRYTATYARLLHLYPKSYRQRFAQPMQQMFVDMCLERKQSGDSLFGFALKVYAETSVGIVKESFKEMAMHSKTTKAKIIIVVSLVGLGTVITVGLLLNNRPTAATIPPMSSFEQARELSKGAKDTCLGDNQQAADAVTRDDHRTVDEYGEFSRFEMIASEGIMDVPAGTNYEVAINSYDNNLAKGSLAYEKEYGTYNYTIKKLPKAGEWEFVSMTACEKQ